MLCSCTRGGEGRGGGGEAGELCRLSSLPPTSEAARRLWGAALEPSISCFTSSRPKCHFLRHVLWGPRGCGAEGPALKVLSRWGAVLARPAFSANELRSSIPPGMSWPWTCSVGLEEKQERRDQERRERKERDGEHISTEGLLGRR